MAIFQEFQPSTTPRITAQEARQMADKGIGLALAAELSTLDEKIRSAAGANQTSLESKGEISPKAKSLLEQDGFKVKDTSFYDQREGYGEKSFTISW